MAAFVIAVLAAVLGLRACEERRVEPTVPSATFTSEIAVLGDGTAMFAPDGTIARTLADWLADRNSTQRYFEAGGRQFDGRSIEPTPEARARLTRLTAMLKAYPQVNAEIIGFATPSGDAQADALLARRRADLVRDLLITAGIRGPRLTSVRGTGGLKKTSESDPLNERIALRLTFPDRATSPASAAPTGLKQRF